MREKSEFIEYFLVHQVEIKAFISSIVRDRSASDDVFQDVAVTLWQKFDQYEDNRSFAAWAKGIARFKILHKWRKMKKDLILLEPNAIEAVLQAYEETESNASKKAEALLMCMEKLPLKSRHLLKYRYEMVLRLKDIGKRLNRSSGAVNQSLHRIRAVLQNCIEKQMQTMDME